MNRLSFLSRVLLLALLPLAALAQDAQEIGVERERIAAERRRIEAELLADEKACYQKFAVTGCIEEARAKRRQVVSDLRRQEIGLNDLERKQRTAERLRELEDKETRQREQQQERSAKGLDKQADRDQRGAEKAAKAQQAASSARARPAPGEPKRLAGEAPDVGASQERYDQRLEDARQHREQVEKRAAQSTKTPKPLPVPP
jgi:colicin import membrane protein